MLGTGQADVAVLPLLSEGIPRPREVNVTAVVRVCQGVKRKLASLVEVRDPGAVAFKATRPSMFSRATGSMLVTNVFNRCTNAANGAH